MPIDPAQRHLLFLNSLPIAVVDFNQDGTIEEWNLAAEKIFGYSRDEAIGKHRSILSPSDEDRVKTEAEWNSTLKHHEPQNARAQNRRKDGSLIWCEWTHQVVLDASEQRMGLISTARDITSMLTAEQKHKQSEATYQQILDAISDLVIVKREKSKIHWANKAFREFYNMDNAALQGLIDAPFNSVDHTQKYMRDDEYVFTNGVTLDIPSEPVNRFDGELRYFHTVKSPIFDENGQVVFLVGIARDITERKTAERLLAEQQSVLIANSKMSALGEMASGIAHEINNPLAIISGKAQQLLSALEDHGSVDPATLKKHLATIDRTAHRIAKIIVSLRTFARDGLKDPMTPFKISALLEETLGLCVERLRENEIKLEIENKAGEASVSCRPSQLIQVLLNLLNNAFDATQVLASKWIRIEAEEKETSFEISVTDSGPGIDPEIREKIMQPFFTTKEIGKGTGLGLSISKGIIETHGGDLFLDFKHAHTRFVVVLPKRQPFTPA